ncbi:hypothetical protein ACFC1R_38475, partial [Kitasatospora sp. NPDC056138]|uniref:hypothetical protein n=1 Tax=Kitasatospora sp. NPDC056138 TaxID=3345724 RepID=UPI0035D79A42
MAEGEFGRLWGAGARGAGYVEGPGAAEVPLSLVTSNLERGVDANQAPGLVLARITGRGNSAGRSSGRGRGAVRDGGNAVGCRKEEGPPVPVPSGRAQPTTPFGQTCPFGSALMENFETVADRLYALAPARFTAARNA